MKEESNRHWVTIQLEKCDIINLIRGIDPNYKVMQIALYMGFGKYSGGFSDEFRWESSTNKCWEVGTAEELCGLYLKFKELLQD